MKDTEYFRQVDIHKNNLQPKAMTNHMLHESCISENCITPINEKNVFIIAEIGTNHGQDENRRREGW